MQFIEIDVSLEKKSTAKVIIETAEAEAEEIESIAQHLLKTARFMRETDELGY